MEQPGDNESFRALQCGRRMFLASLILASKYLQDRNFSARAWSKISGLKTQEINTNEMTFLNAINWSLHIPEGIFERWTDIVLKYTPPSQATDASCPPTARSCSSWKSIVLRLTPRLDTVELPTTSPTSAKFSWVNNGIQNLHLPSTPTPTSEAFGSTSQEGTPTPSSNKILLEDRLKKKPSMSSLTTPPRFLEPKPDMPPPTPHLARMGPLPTPQLTPSSVASNTPAVGISSCASSRRPSMASCMAQAKNVCLARTAYDHWITPASAPTKGNSCGLEQYSLSRRSSVARSTSSGSSPESMISDLTSRSSRASSISSVSSAPNWAPTCKLARLATCRNAKLPVLGQGFTQPSKDGNGMVNIVDSDLARPEAIISEEGFVPSPESLDYFSLPQPSAAIKMPLRRKPSVMLPNPSTPQKQRPVARTACSSPLKPEPFHGRKRGRSSTDFSLQQNVRDLLCAAPSKPTSTPVRPDMRRADSSSSVRSCSAILSRNTNISTLPIRSALSFANSNSGSVTPCAKRDEDETEDDDATPVTSGHGKRGPQSPHANRNPRMPVEKDVAGKKRACCCAEEERKRTSCGREGSFRMEGRPGMWEGVL
ncbi:MAG: hypothetical protein M1820_002030 [Bogoriella megaspora]|nr:MAG: hypothetical protein M1820_002030 [Bogoriella megaspora]